MNHIVVDMILSEIFDSVGLALLLNIDTAIWYLLPRVH